MVLLLIFVLLFCGLGGGFYGYNRYGTGGGLGIGGIFLVLLVLFCLFGRGRF